MSLHKNPCSISSTRPYLTVIDGEAGRAHCEGQLTLSGLGTATYVPESSAILSLALSLIDLLASPTLVKYMILINILIKVTCV